MRDCPNDCRAEAWEDIYGGTHCLEHSPPISPRLVKSSRSLKPRLLADGGRDPDALEEIRGRIRPLPRHDCACEPLTLDETTPNRARWVVCSFCGLWMPPPRE